MASLHAPAKGQMSQTPEAPLALYSALRFLKYALVPIYIIHFAPAAFQRLGI